MPKRKQKAVELDIDCANVPQYPHGLNNKLKVVIDRRGNVIVAEKGRRKDRQIFNLGVLYARAYLSSKGITIPRRKRRA